MIEALHQSEGQSLKEYQASILARLEAAKSGDVAQGARYLGVMVGGQSLLVPMQAVKEAMSLLEMFPVPLAKPWLLGMANVRGTLYGITDLGYFLHGKPSQATSSSRILLLNDELHSHVGLLVDQLIGIRRLESMRVIEGALAQGLEAETDLVAERSRDLVEQDGEHYCSEMVYEDMEQQRWQIFDVQALINGRGFMHPA